MQAQHELRVPARGAGGGDRVPRSILDQRIAATADEGRWLSAVAAMERTGNAASARVAYASVLKRWPENLSGALGLASVLR